MIDWTYPWFLLLLPGLLLLWFPLRRTLVNLTPTQRVVLVGVRGLALALVIVALAGPRWRSMSDRLALVYLVDDSASVSNEGRAAARNYVDRSVKTRRPQDDFAVVGFAQSATVWRSFGSNEALGHWTPLQENWGTDLRKALQFAASILPRDRRGKIVLLTDGNDTGAGAEATIADLRRSGVEVLAVPLENPDRPETLVESVSLPRNIAGGEPFDLAAAIRSTRAQKATVKLYENQFLLQERPADLVAGRNLVRFENLTSEGSQYEIEVQPAEDTFAENNLAKAVAQIRGQPKILLVDPEENRMEPLARVLRAERFQVEVRTPQGFPRSIDDLDRFDLVLVSDVPALLFSQQQMDLLRTWVRDFGGGFVLTGGENSFGIGGYYRTPVEQLLPVRMEHDDRQETPSVALLVILDRSGSMAAQVQGKTKITLANQGAVLALDVLKENDYFGVYAVDTKVHQIVPLGRVQDRQNVQQQILGIESAGGGIYIYTSLLEASKAMRDINAQIKHVILFSDSADAEEKFAGEMGDGAEGSGSALDLASMMLTSRVTTSVVALGYESDKDTPFLKLLAERGNGRFYLTNDPLNLPQIFTTETMKVAQSSLIEEPFVPQPARESKVTEGIDWTQAPLLLGYNSTKPKPTAEVLLSTENGEPLLATWRFGLGQTAAFTSDVKSRWASEWLGWPGYGKLWTQVVRALMRRSDRGLLQVRTEERENRLRVSVDAVRPDGSYANELPITLISADPEGQTETVTAGQTGPGRYVADVALPERGVRLLSVSTPNNPPVTLSYAHSYPAEFIETRTNHEGLERLVGRESLGVSADKLFSAGPAVGGQRRDLAPWLLTLAALLLPLDIFLRRRAG